MKVKDAVALLLQKDQEADLMFQDPNAHGGPFSVGKAEERVAEEGQFPEDFNMPAGYKFVLLETY